MKLIARRQNILIPSPWPVFSSAGRVAAAAPEVAPNVLSPAWKVIVDILMCSILVSILVSVVYELEACEKCFRIDTTVANQSELLDDESSTKKPLLARLAVISFPHTYDHK